MFILSIRIVASNWIKNEMLGKKENKTKHLLARNINLTIFRFKYNLSYLMILMRFS